MSLRVKVIVQRFAGALFLASGVLKVFSFEQFVLSVMGFKILPSDYGLQFAIGIVMMEILSGVALLSNVKVKLFSGILVALLIIFMTAISINLLRHNMIACGCFGSHLSGSISWWDVLRNLVLCFILCWIGYDQKSDNANFVSDK